MLTILRQSCVKCCTKRYLQTTCKSNGYIVLVPEIGEEGHLTESIIKPDGLPAFNDLTIEMCLGTIGQQAGAVETAVKNLEAEIQENSKVNTSHIFCTLDIASGPLDTTWGIAKALYLGNSTLIPTKSYLNIHERARNARATKFCSKILYNALKKNELDVNIKEERLRQKFLLEGKLNGLTLDYNKRERLKDILSQLGKERASFKNKVNIATHSFVHIIKDYSLVRDFPHKLLKTLAMDPQQPMKGPWKITLQPQIVEEFLKYCPDRMQRWNVWRANVLKASPQLDKSLENSTHLEKIRALRKRQANMLGYPTYADMSMQTKMIKTVGALKQMLAKLLQFAGPAQTTEIANLQQYAKSHGFNQKLDLYDIEYWSRKLLSAVHEVNEIEINKYFPLSRVMSGAFVLSEKLFNIKIELEPNAEVWHPAVKFFHMYDLDVDTKKPVAGFYVDAYSKQKNFGKTNGWMVGIRNRNDSANLAPLCALIFNFPQPTREQEQYLLNYEDLQMVFKTFGTALQHLLTKARYTDLAGLSNIEWDASQVSGYVMSNFLDNTAILKSLSGHYQTDEVISNELIEKAKLFKTHLAGYNLCKELYYADLDIELNCSSNFWLDVVRNVWPIYMCLPLNKKDSHPCSMVDIFAGDWAAAQFSHLHSKMLAADISTNFYNARNVYSLTDVGKRYKDTFLTSGGSLPTSEVFRRFQGRDPSVEALLKSLNIYNVTQTTNPL